MARYLPCGIENFRTLRASRKALYIDKTERIAALIEEMELAPHAFLARPRRFGKSLWLSTLRSLFLGERALFEGTWIGRAGHWDWERDRYPVLLLNMAIRNVREARRLEDDVMDLVADQAQWHGIELPAARSPSRLLTRLLQTLAHKYERKIVVLVDEYDTAITENMERPDVLADVVDVMRAFYGALKDNSDSIRYAFVTGITRFAYTDLFAGANPIVDMSFRPQCHSMLGFTQREIEQDPDITSDIESIASAWGCAYKDLLAALRNYYHGYCFSAGEEAIYNPFSLSLCLASLRSAGPGSEWTLDNLPNAWADSGTTASLFRLWKTGRYRAPLETALRTACPWQVVRQPKYDAAQMDIAALMFHAGYLTVKEERTGAKASRAGLDFPNEEVRLTFRTALADWQADAVAAWCQGEEPQVSASLADIRQSMQEGDPERLREVIDAFLQQFPYPDRILPPSAKTPQDYEAHYQAILYGAFKIMGLPVHAHRPTARGRFDIAVDWPRRAVLLELKAAQTAEEAVKQALEKGYADPFMPANKPVTVIGLRFNTARRAVQDAAQWHLGTYDRLQGRWEHEPFRQPLAALRRMDETTRSRLMQESLGKA